MQTNTAKYILLATGLLVEVENGIMIRNKTMGRGGRGRKTEQDGPKWPSSNHGWIIIMISIIIKHNGDDRVGRVPAL